MDAALEGHFITEKGVDHSVAGGLHFGLERVGCNDESGRGGGVYHGESRGIPDCIFGGPDAEENKMSWEQWRCRLNTYLKWVSLDELPCMALW